MATTKKLGHVVRNPEGTLIATVSQETMLKILQKFGVDMRVVGENYVYRGTQIISVSDNKDDLCVYFLNGYTFSCIPK